MEKVIVFVDGFNVYHSLDTKDYKKYKWLDLCKLSKCFIIQSKQELKSVYYFSAYAYWDQEKVIPKGIQFVKFSRLSTY